MVYFMCAIHQVSMRWQTETVELRDWTYERTTTMKYRMYSTAVLHVPVMLRID